MIAATLPEHLTTLENAPEAFLRNYGRRIRRWRASEVDLAPYFEQWCAKYGPELERRQSHKGGGWRHESIRSS